MRHAGPREVWDVPWAGEERLAGLLVSAESLRERLGQGGIGGLRQGFIGGG